MGYRCIGEWLDQIGLGQYVSTFRDNDIDIDILPDIGEKDLEKLGVSMGHRKRMLRAIASLTDGHSAEQSASSHPPAVHDHPATASGAQRRHLTVMFCDLVDSTALSERLDPEDLRDVLARYQAACAKIVNRFEGCVARYVGDGLLIYFGYPSAHEDDACRAIHAGLSIIEAMQQLSRENETARLNVRIGVATGLVVVGDIGSSADLERMAVVGETPNIAARLQGLAAPDTIVISESTRDLVEDVFDCSALTPAHVKGISSPLRIFGIGAQSSKHSRFDTLTARKLTPVVGRDEELDLMTKRWGQCIARESQLILLSAEAGIGKSQVVRHFQERIRTTPHNRILYFCSPYHSNSALYPVIEQFERVLHFESDDDQARKAEKLRTLMVGLGLSSDEQLAACASLLSVCVSDMSPVADLEPQQLKNRILESMVAIVAAMTDVNPVLMIVEDAHWIDPSTVQYLDLLLERLKAHRLLLIVTYRPEAELPWQGYPQATLLKLSRLSRKECTQLLDNLCGGRPLPENVVEQIIARTDGVPLFVEEFGKTILESGLLKDAGDRYVLDSTLQPLAIPATLQDSLMARLDRWPHVRGLAQLAATIGRTFGHRLIASVSGLDPSELNLALAELTEAELIFRRGLDPDYFYEFKHALVRDAAYESLLKTTRCEHHRVVVSVLETQFEEVCVSQPELLAYHCSQGQLQRQAVEYWLKAGRLAASRSADDEAIAHLSSGLEMLSVIADAPDRSRLELDLYLAIGPVLMSTKGFTATEAEEAYVRAQRLCRRVGTPQELFTATWGLWLFNQQLGELGTARSLADEILSIARLEHDQEILLQAHHATWTTLYRLGEFSTSFEHTEQGIRLYQFEQHRTQAARYAGHDPGVCAFWHAAKNSWILGFPDRAVEKCAASLTLAERLEQPSSLVLASTFAAFVRQWRREAGHVRELTTNVLALCEERSVAPHCAVAAKILRAWSLVMEDQVADGIALMREGLDTLRASRTRAHGPYLLGVCAEICWLIDRTDEGREVLGEALQMIEQTSERTWEAELHRMDGDVRLAQPVCDQQGAADRYQRALAIARNQGARSLELRAAVSLADLWQRQDKQADAFALLAPIYDSFTEGKNTATLEQAALLLDDLRNYVNA